MHVDYTMVLEVRNRPGVLVRIAHLFARRGCNIQALHVQPKPGTDWSIMTLTVRDVSHIEQIIHQLEKLVDVARVDAHKAKKQD